MNPIEKLKQELDLISGIETNADFPEQPTGAYWLDIRKGREHFIVVEWRFLEGFGISQLNEESGYGVGSDQIFDNYDAALDHILSLLKSE